MKTIAPWSSSNSVSFTRLPPESPSKSGNTDLFAGFPVTGGPQHRFIIMDFPLTMQPSPLPNLPLSDQELFHHYTTVTSFSFTNDPSVKQMWQSRFPREAQRYQFLMHALLALSATHLMRICPDQRSVHMRNALKHQQMAFRSSIPIFHDITPDNCHAIFTVAGIIALLAFALPQSSNPSTPKEPIDAMLGFFTLIRGAMTVLQTARQWIKLGGTDPSFQHNRIFKVVSLRSDMTEALDRLQQTNEQVNLSPAFREAYASAIKGLGVAFEARAALWEEQSLVFNWPVILSETFVTKLREGEPFALVILAHYGGLLDCVTSTWWSQARGGKLVEAVYQNVSIEWEALMEWPLEVIREGLQHRIDALSVQSPPPRKAQPSKHSSGSEWMELDFMGLEFDDMRFVQEIIVG